MGLLAFLPGLFLLLTLTNSLVIDRRAPPPPPIVINATNGVVSTESAVCSQVGVDILKLGGNAVDAAIAATFCIGVVHSFSAGIGGGGFMTVRLPPYKTGNKSEIWTIDFRERAPAAATPDMFVANPSLSLTGGLASGVPGEVLGLETAFKQWGSGRVTWAQLLKPSVDLARNGWKAERFLEAILTNLASFILNDPEFSAIFAPTGLLIRQGEIVKRENFSRTLELIADQGSVPFYHGSIAKLLVDKTKATGGILTHEDFQNYTVDVQPALQGRYRGKNVYTMHAPSSGPALIHMLNLAQYYDMSKVDLLTIHRLVEMIKFGFGARTIIGDPASLNDTERARINEIPTAEFAAKIVKKITDGHTHTSDYYLPESMNLRDHGTSHISVADKDGSAVAITSTINLVFGSHVMEPETGIILNNQMDDFANPGDEGGYDNNFPGPWKRPLSSMVPTIIESHDGELEMVVGASGSQRILSATYQVIVDVVDRGWDVGTAIGYGRLHDQLYPPIVEMDNTLPGWLRDGLRGLGHNVTLVDIWRTSLFANVDGVVVVDGKFQAASDFRKGGRAAGY